MVKDKNTNGALPSLDEMELQEVGARMMGPLASFHSNGVIRLNRAATELFWQEGAFQYVQVYSLKRDGGFYVAVVPCKEADRAARAFNVRPTDRSDLRQPKGDVQITVPVIVQEARKLAHAEGQMLRVVPGCDEEGRLWIVVRPAIA